MAWNFDKAIIFLRSDFKNVFVIILLVALYSTVKDDLKVRDEKDVLLVESAKIHQDQANDKEKLFFMQVEVTRAWKEINAITSQELEKYNINNRSPFDADSAAEFYPKQYRR